MDKYMLFVDIFGYFVKYLLNLMCMRYVIDM